MIRPPPRSTLLPYTTLVRSVVRLGRGADLRPDRVGDRAEVLDRVGRRAVGTAGVDVDHCAALVDDPPGLGRVLDRKSTRLNSSHGNLSYAVFWLNKNTTTRP